MELIRNEEAEVKPLHQKTKWDVLLKGSTWVRLEILDSETAQWVQELKTRDVAPPIMLQVLPESELDKKTTRVLAEWRWKSKWYDRLIFRTKEKDLICWVHKNHKKLLEMQREAQQEPERTQQVKKILEIP
jgi:hypothetical protein